MASPTLWKLIALAASAAVWMGAGGCGRLLFDPRSEAGDGGGTGDAAAPGDAATQPLPPFSPPQLIDVVSSPDDRDDDPTLPSDGLEMYFATTRDGGSGDTDIWVSRRASIADPWGVPEPVDELNTSRGETDPDVSPDGLTMWLSSDRTTVNDYDLWVASRPDRSSPWSAAVRVGELVTADDEFAPTATADQLTLVYAIDAEDEDLFLSQRPNQADPWHGGQAIVELNTNDDDAQPHLTGAGEHVIFASDRPGGDGNRDLYLATRSANGEFDAAVRLGELCSPAYDGGPWISDDLRYVVFSSSVSGEFHLYEARR